MSAFFNVLLNSSTMQIKVNRYSGSHTFELFWNTIFEIMKFQALILNKNDW